VDFELDRTFGFLHPYIIAEIGVNHGGDIDLAKKMIKECAESGAHGAKFQSYKAEKIASKEHSKYYWDLSEESSTSQFELFKKYDAFGEKEYAELAEYCKLCGIDFLSTPFDMDAVDMLDPHVPFFKIASADITNIPLLKKIGSKKKLVVLSTGASTLEEIHSAIKILNTNGAKKVCLLHCVLNYPTPPQNAQMVGIPNLMRDFHLAHPIGYSDHVKPSSDGSLPALIMASILGSVIIEKHYTYDKSLKGNDHYHAMDKTILKNFVEQLKYLNTLYGVGEKNLDIEMRAREKARRRICLKRNLEAGDVLTEENLIALRADTGIEIAQWEQILGQKLNIALFEGTPVDWEHIKK
jgi:sialic acid synthase SpsE